MGVWWILVAIIAALGYWASQSIVGAVVIVIFCLAWLGVMAYAWFVYRPKQEQQEAEAERKRLEEKRNKEKEREALEKEVAYSEGLEKIVKMRPLEIQKHMEELAKAKKDLESSESLQKNSSMLYEKKGDWAVAGGLAQGIAGPAAGYLAAQDVIRENQAIDQRNKNISMGLAYHQMFYLPKIRDRVEKLEHSIPTEVTIEELQTKHDVILSWSPRTLFSKLHFYNKQCIRDEETNSIVVSTKCCIEKYLDFIIDGSLRAKLYTSDKKYVGCAYLNLPYYFCSDDTLSGIITSSNIYDMSFLRDVKDYEIVIDYVDLWEQAPKKHRFLAQNRGDKLTAEEHRQIVAEHEAKFKKEENKALGR